MKRAKGVHALLTILVGACSFTQAEEAAFTASPEETRESIVSAADTVSFETEEGVTLSGSLFGAGSQGVIMTHEPELDRTVWEPLATELAARGYLVLTYDLRGRGESENNPYLTRIRDDMLSAVRFMENQGVRELALVGADFSGTEVVNVALKVEPAAIILISAPRSIFITPTLERGVTDEDLEKLKGAKLVIAAKDDVLILENELNLGLVYAEIHYHAEALYFNQTMSDPVEFLELEGSAHGSAVLESEQGEQVIAGIIKFLTMYMPVEQ